MRCLGPGAVSRASESGCPSVAHRSPRFAKPGVSDNARVSMPEVIERGVRLRLLDIPWTRVAELDLRRTAVFLLSGPLEQHGPHLPLGADLYQAGAVMGRVAPPVSKQGLGRADRARRRPRH